MCQLGLNIAERELTRLLRHIRKSITRKKLFLTRFEPLTANLLVRQAFLPTEPLGLLVAVQYWTVWYGMLFCGLS